MAVVDLEEQQRRQRAGSGTFTVVFIAFLLGMPVIGWFGALIAACWMAAKVWTKSANRLIDMSLALGGLIPYYLIVWLTAGNIADGIFGAWLSASLFSLAWVWLLHARAGVAND